RRPSQRLGASSAHRISQLPDFEFSATSLTIVREPLRDESTAFLRVRVRCRRGGRIFDYPPLAARADGAEAADHIGRDAIDERELVRAAKRARVTARHE